MRIGIIIGRIGGVDGVALETEKWITVLRRLGHRVFVLTGQLEGARAPCGQGGIFSGGDLDGVEQTTLLPELAFDHPAAVEGQEMAFFGRSVAEADLLAKLTREAELIERGILRWVEQQRIGCILSEQACALPFHLTMGMALKRVFERTELLCVTHDHDFRWERGERYASPFAGVRLILEQCFPPQLPKVRHAVINSAARAKLQQLGIAGAVVVPNVMDFDAPFGQRDEHNADLRRALGLPEHATLLFQVTRIVARKGIETAVELVHRIADPAVHLVITGTAKDEPDQSYPAFLARRVTELGLTERVHFASEHFGNQRTAGVYSLSDAYAHADACTYFSTYEGFGNAFVEAVVARRPIFVNNYEPVYWPDIGSLGFDTVMIEGGQLTEEAVGEVREVLSDPARRRRMVEHNLALGRRHFSYQALEALLKPLFTPNMW